MTPKARNKITSNKKTTDKTSKNKLTKNPQKNKETTPPPHTHTKSTKKRVWLIPALVEDSLKVPWHYMLRLSLQLLLPFYM